MVSAHAGSKVLQNDGFNGFGSVACQLGAVEGEILAARFSADPGDYPFTIQKIEALVCPAGRTGYFTVSVWADDGVSPQPGTLLFSEIYQMTGTDLSLNSIDLSAQNIVITSGKVRVGFELFQNPGPSLATDTDGTISAGANFIYVHPIWYYSENLGLLSDWIEPSVGLFSLRYAMLSILILNVWAAVHFFLAGRTIAADYERAGRL